MYAIVTHTRGGHFLTVMISASILLADPAFGQDCRQPDDPIPVTLTVTKARSFKNPDPEGLFGDGPELYVEVLFFDEDDVFLRRFLLSMNNDSGYSKSDLGSCTIMVQPQPEPPLINVELRLWDADAFFAGGDEHIDISPVADQANLRFTYDPFCNEIFDRNDEPDAIPGCPNDGVHRDTCSGGVAKHSVANHDGSYRGSIDFWISAASSPVNEDLYLNRFEVIQVTPDPAAMVHDKSTMVRAQLSSTYSIPTTTEVRARAIDKQGNVFQDTQNVVIPACGVTNVNMFQGLCPGGAGAPAFRPQDGPLNFMQVIVEVDPNHDLDCPPDPAGGCDLDDCRIVNNRGANRTMRIKRTRDLRVLYQPFTGSVLCGPLRVAGTTWGEADDAIFTRAAADTYLLDLYPIASTDTAFTEIPFPFHHPATLPYEIPLLICPHLSLIQHDLIFFLTGYDRVVGIVKDDFFFCHYLACGGSSGASAGGFGRHGVILESQVGAVSSELVAHELGHTYDLSEYQCPLGGIFSGILCNDEYQFCEDDPDPGGICADTAGDDDGARSFGFNVRACQNRDNWPCVMGRSGVDPPGHWIDRIDYDHLLDWLKLSADPEVLWLRIHVDKCGGGTFYRDDASRAEGVADFIGEFAGGPGFERETTSLVFKDAAGATLERVNFTPELFVTSPPGGGVEAYLDHGYGYPCREEVLDETDMALVVPLPAETAEILLSRRDLCAVGCDFDIDLGDCPFVITDTLIVPPEEVAVELRHPPSSVKVRPGDEIGIRWEIGGLAGAASPKPTTPEGDGPSHLSYVLVSPDNGASWIPLASRVTGNEYTWQSEVEGRLLFRVFTTNGFNTDDVRGESDLDADGCGDSHDPSPTTADSDSDGDGIADVCDNCTTDSNGVQEDTDRDGTGDACDSCTDSDGDGFGDPGHPANTCVDDNCPSVPNTAQIDTDDDGVGDVCDLCPNTIPNVEVDADGCPPLAPGDFDRDGDVDTHDFSLFQMCALGPEVPHPPTGCDQQDFDIDGDIDSTDFAVFQRCYSGENNPADPNCAD